MVGVLRTYRLELVGALAIVAVLGFLLAWPLFRPGPAPLPAGLAPATGGRATLPTLVPATPGPTRQPGPVPTPQPALLGEQEVIEMVQIRPVNGVPGTTMRQKFTAWRAEYRGDGSWMVRADDASWIVFEQSRAAMPANLAAINVETSGSRRGTR